jgi:hypothetical protein
MLCVLLGHAFIVLALMNLTRPDARSSGALAADAEAIYFISEQPVYEEYDDRFPVPEPEVNLNQPQTPDLEGATGEPAAGESAAITSPGYVDWPKEGRDAAARVLAAEAEAERVAKMFAGPQGTWASLTKRQKSELSSFRWRPGIDGLERDEKGNTIYQMPNGCALVNFQFIGCPLGKKPPPYGDLFKDMRKYFDEQRLPQTKEGNGREPESMRPPKWSKPLP